jgi:hypothetical protein
VQWFIQNYNDARKWKKLIAFNPGNTKQL